MRAILVVSALLLVPADPPPKGGRTAEAGDKMVCKRQAKTGTRFKTAICHSQREWDAIAANAGQSAHEMIDRPVIPLNGGAPNPMPQSRASDPGLPPGR